MRILATVDCSGAQVVMEVDAQGNLIFHNHDFEADMAAEALGFETTECLRLARGWEEAQSAIFIREFPLDGEVWFAVLVAWLEKIAWAYSSVMELAEGVGIELSVLPFEALATVQQHVTYGLTLSREETVALSDKIRELDRSLTGAISERLEDNYQENISSLIGAASAFLRALAKLIFFSPGFNAQMLAGTPQLRKDVADRIQESRYLTEFLKVRGESEPGRTHNSMFLEASARTAEAIDQMIRQAVEIAHGME